VSLANAEDVKGGKGHKTDRRDSKWLAHLLRHDMVRASFVPPRPIRELRDLTRRRKQLFGDATSERNRVQKTLAGCGKTRKNLPKHVTKEMF